MTRRDTTAARTSSGATAIPLAPLPMTPVDTTASRPRLTGRTRRRDAILRRSLALGDAAVVVVALLLVTLDGDAGFRWPTVVLPFGFVLLGKVARLYENDALQLRRSSLDEAPVIFTLAALLALLTWLAGDLLVTGELGRSAVAELWLLILVGAVLVRSLLRRGIRRTRTRERCMLIGDPAAWARIKQSMGLRADLELACHFPIATPAGHTTRPLGQALAAAGDRLRDIVERERVDRVLLAVSRHDDFDDTFLDGVFALEQLGLRVNVVPQMLEVIGSAGQLEELDGLPVLGIRPFGLNRTSRWLKRAFDLAIASLLLVITLPVFAVAAVAVRRSGPGPILYRQRRVGLRGQEFELLKFRSMVDGADTQRRSLATRNATTGVFKLLDDPRVTPAGRWLRRTSLDELPQLFNVLGGSMSLVGPRPLVPCEDALVHGWRRRRLELPPGMTGPWQILISTRVPLDEMVKMDYLYIANWSPWADIKALLRTLPHVFGRRGL